MKTLPVYKSLHQQWLNPITFKPVHTKMLQRPGQRHARQIFYPGQDQQPAVVDHMLQALRTCAVIPTDPLISGLYSPGRTGKLHAGNHFPAGSACMYQILQPCAVRHGITKIMVPAEQVLKQQPLFPVSTSSTSSGVNSSTLPHR